ncbi:MAG: hypothetical protein R2731_12995 [Nocardioides sp.]
MSQLGGVGGGSGLVAKLLPILAPIVLSYLAKQVSPAGGGGIRARCCRRCWPAAQGSGGLTRRRQHGVASTDVLGGLLGGGRRG